MTKEFPIHSYLHCGSQVNISKHEPTHNTEKEKQIKLDFICAIPEMVEFHAFLLSVYKQDQVYNVKKSEIFPQEENGK